MHRKHARLANRECLQPMKMAKEQGCGLVLKNEFPQELLVIYRKIVVGFFALRMQGNMSEGKRMVVCVLAFNELVFQPATLLQATIELGTKVSNVIARDCIADADEFAVLVCERIVVILGKVLGEHGPKDLPAGSIVGIPEDDMNWQSKIDSRQHLLYCLAVNITQDQHEIRLWRELLHLVQHHPKLASTGAFGVSVDADVRVSIDHEVE